MGNDGTLDPADRAGLFTGGGIFPGPPRFCPKCSGTMLRTVVDGGGVHFRCQQCGATVFVERGMLWTLTQHDERSQA